MAVDRTKLSKEVHELNATNLMYKGHIENLGEVLIDLVFSLAKESDPGDEQ